MKYINTLKEGDVTDDIYLCKEKKRQVDKNGKPYDVVTLQDKTGTIDGKIWDVNSPGIDEFDKLDYVYIKADVTVFREQPQLKITRARKAGEGEYNPGDYLPVSERDINQMYEELLGYVDSIEDKDYKTLLEYIFKNNAVRKVFCFKSAAKSVHHGFVGGLLEHTTSVTRNCNYFAQNYPFLNRDLLLTAAMFHDLGKINELSDFPENDYTDEGQLLGHIVMGVEMIDDALAKLKAEKQFVMPKVKANQLKHCILAHHGELEFGSPKKPALVEAMALSFADNIDAKMETFKEALRDVPETDTNWQGFNRFLDTNIRRTI